MLGHMTDLELMIRFLLQAFILLGACKIVGWIGVKFLGQTQVVMEMVTGVLLGPSLFGWLAPQIQNELFPKTIQYVIDGQVTTAKHPSMFILYIVAQIGLVFYMFLVGLEFDTKLISDRIGGAVSVSLAGIVAPFILGGIIAATVMQGHTDFFGPNITLPNQVLYLGAAMCITAFPMLARIIYERGISGTALGTLSLGAGAVDDAVAWSLLAVVLASSKGDPSIAILAVGGGTLFAILVLTVGKKLMARFSESVEATGKVSNALFTAVLLSVVAGAYITDAIGIYAVFGAFLTGAAMPRGKFAEIIREKLEFFTVGFFLPFFFVYSGLNTQLGLINSAYLWEIALLVLAAAIIGKGVACALAARFSGEPWADSWAIGTLMNSRGLMELIILNIALQQKIITPTLFSIMVIMAIVTTLMASPIFALIYPKTQAFRLARKPA